MSEDRLSVADLAALKEELRDGYPLDRSDVRAVVSEVEALRAERADLAAAIRALAEHAGRTGAALGVAYDPAYLRWSHLIDSLAEPDRSLLRAILDASPEPTTMEPQ